MVDIASVKQRDLISKELQRDYLAYRQQVFAASRNEDAMLAILRHFVVALVGQRKDLRTLLAHVF